MNTKYKIMKKLKEGERDSLSFVYLLSGRVVVEVLIMDIKVEETAVCTVDKEKSKDFHISSYSATDVHSCEELC